MSQSSQWKSFPIAVWQGKRSNVSLLLKIGLAFVVLAAIWWSALPSTASTWAAQKYPIFGNTAVQTPGSAKNVAVIIENRPLANLAPLILHFASVLGPAWPIIFYTTDNPLLSSSAAFHRAVTDGRIKIRKIPERYDFASHQSVTEFLTEPWVWEQLAPAEHVLLFQADSVLCANSDLQVDDFLKYDLVGAPVASQFGAGFNGGLSLRNRTMILEIINEFSWKKESQDGTFDTMHCGGGDPCVQFEDQWFYHKMTQRNARLPSLEVAKTFAVETIWYEKPLGYHQVERWNHDNMGKVDLWCPEYKLATEDLLVTHG